MVTSCGKDRKEHRIGGGNGDEIWEGWKWKDEDRNGEREYVKKNNYGVKWW